jgi:hypothetical protein
MHRKQQCPEPFLRTGCDEKHKSESSWRKQWRDLFLHCLQVNRHTAANVEGFLDEQAWNLVVALTSLIKISNFLGSGAALL